jgi:hypothetical protein
MAKKTERREVKQFVLGRDFTAQEIELLAFKIAKWFRDPTCDRRHDDPEAAAKEIIEQCLNATTKDGSPWRNAPAEFAARIKVKAAYDMTTDTGIPIKAVKHPDAVRRLDPEADANGKKLDVMQPALVDFDSAAFRALEESKLLTQYPELNNPVHLPHVRRLTLLYAQQEIIDRELLLAVNARKREDALRQMEVLNKTMESVLKILDIHPESLRKKIKESADGSVGDLVAVLDADEDFRPRERLWALQAALQLWSMTVRPNGRGDGPQLSEWECWHATRSAPMAFTCRCGAHYPALVRGFTPKQLKKYLIERGVLIEQPAIPHLIRPEDVAGLSAFIDALPDDPTPGEVGHGE